MRDSNGTDKRRTCFGGLWPASYHDFTRVNERKYSVESQRALCRPSNSKPSLPRLAGITAVTPTRSPAMPPAHVSNHITAGYGGSHACPLCRNHGATIAARRSSMFGTRRLHLTRCQSLDFRGAAAAAPAVGQACRGAANPVIPCARGSQASSALTDPIAPDLPETDRTSPVSLALRANQTRGRSPLQPPSETSQENEPHHACSGAFPTG